MKKYLISLSIVLSGLVLSGQDVVWKMTYDVGFPFGTTKEFADQVSWRGLSLDADRFLNDNLAVGLGFAWSTFVQKYPDSFWERDRVLLHGTQVRYINNIPVTGRISWYQPMDNVEPFFSLGIGTVWQEMRREIGLWSFTDSYWQFLLAPEIGVVIPVGFSSYATLKVKYTQGFQTSDNDNALSYLSVGVGVAW
jgi:hypothetical protein